MASRKTCDCALQLVEDTLIDGISRTELLTELLQDAHVALANSMISNVLVRTSTQSVRHQGQGKLLACKEFSQ